MANTKRMTAASAKESPHPSANIVGSLLGAGERIPTGGIRGQNSVAVQDRADPGVTELYRRVCRSLGRRVASASRLPTLPESVTGSIGLWSRALSSSGDEPGCIGQGFAYGCGIPFFACLLVVLAVLAPHVLVAAIIAGLTVAGIQLFQTTAEAGIKAVTKPAPERNVEDRRMATAARSRLTPTSGRTASEKTAARSPSTKTSTGKCPHCGRGSHFRTLGSGYRVCDSCSRSHK